MAEPIKIDGLSQFRANLRALDRSLPRTLRLAFNEAADIVASDARPRVPARSGRARATVKVKSTQSYARVAGGSGKASYYPWLDFGGRVGRNKSVKRQFLKDGRYIYYSYNRNRDRFRQVLEESLTATAVQAGFEVD